MVLKSLINREIQIKTTMRYHLISVRMTVSSIQVITSAGKDMEKRVLALCWWECKLIQSLWKGMKVPEEIKNRMTIWSTIWLLGIYTKEMKSLSWRDVCTSMFNAVLFTTVNMLVKGYKLSVIIWIMTEDLVYYIVTTADSTMVDY